MVKLPPKAGEIAKKKAEEAEKKKDDQTAEVGTNDVKPSGNPLSSLVKPRERNFDRNKAKTKQAGPTQPRGPKVAVRMAEVEPVTVEPTFAEQRDQIDSEIKQEVHNSIKKQLEMINQLNAESSSKADTEEEESEVWITFKSAVQERAIKFIEEGVSLAFQAMCVQSGTQIDGTSQTQPKFPGITRSCQTEPGDFDFPKVSVKNNSSETAALWTLIETERSVSLKQANLLTGMVKRLGQEISTLIDSTREDATQENPSENESEIETLHGSSPLFDDSQVEKLVQLITKLTAALKDSREQHTASEGRVQALASGIEQATKFIQLQKNQISELEEEQDKLTQSNQALHQAVTVLSQDKELMKEVCYLLLQQLIGAKDESNTLLEEISKVQYEYSSSVETSNKHILYLMNAFERISHKIAESRTQQANLLDSLRREARLNKSLVAEGSKRYENMLIRYNQERDDWDSYKSELESYSQSLETSLGEYQSLIERQDQEKLVLEEETTSLSRRNEDLQELVQSYEGQWEAIWSWIRTHTTTADETGVSITDALHLAQTSIRDAASDYLKQQHDKDTQQILSEHKDALEALKSELTLKLSEMEQLRAKHTEEVEKLTSAHHAAFESIRSEVLQIKSHQETVTSTDQSEELDLLKGLNTSLTQEVSGLETLITNMREEIQTSKEIHQQQLESSVEEIKKCQKINGELEEKVEMLYQEVQKLMQEKTRVEEHEVEPHPEEIVDPSSELKAAIETVNNQLATAQETLEGKTTEVEGLLQDKIILQSQLEVAQTEKDELVHQLRELQDKLAEQTFKSEQPAALVVKTAEVEDKETQSDPEVIESDPDEPADPKKSLTVHVDPGVSTELIEDLKAQLQQALDKIAALEHKNLSETGDREVFVDTHKQQSNSSGGEGEDPDEFVKIGHDSSTPSSDKEQWEGRIRELEERVSEQDNKNRLLLLDLEEADLVKKTLEKEYTSLKERFLAEIQLAAESNGHAARQFLTSLNQFK